MIKVDKFVMSHRPYAVDLDSFKIDRHNVYSHGESWQATVDAVWYRKKQGRVVAHMGLLWDVQRTKPLDALQFLAQHDDGRYGGSCYARWDGDSYWGTDIKLDDALAVLRPVLESYPDVPAGYDGWWRF